MTVKVQKAFEPESLGLDVSHMAGDEAICHCYLDSHQDSNPSASFNVLTGAYYCFGCKHGTHAYEIAKETGGIVRKIPLSQMPTRIKEQRDDWQWLMNRPLALDNWYLQKRGITNDTVRRFGIREAQIGIGVIIRGLDGSPIGAQIRKYEAQKAKYLTLGDRPPFWPAENAKRNVYMTEGIFGVFNAHKYGYDVVTTMGAGVSQQFYEILKSLAPVAVFDNDFPGLVGAGKIVYHCHGKALVPGYEADEDNWDIINAKMKTSNIVKIADFASEFESRSKFYKQVIGRKKWAN